MERLCFSLCGFLDTTATIFGEIDLYAYVCYSWIFECGYRL